MSPFAPTALVLLALTAPAPSPPADVPKGDLARLQGTWAASVGARKKLRVTVAVDGRDVAIEIKGPVGPPIKARGRVRLDGATSPKTLDWVGLTASDGQEIPEILGIYALDGDSLRICTGGLNNPRPSAFEPGESALSDVVTLRRTPAAEGGDLAAGNARP